MNNYIALEIHDLANKLKGYNVLFNYRLSNLCVKAEPTALMPVTVLVADTEYNLEEVANIMRPDDFSFDVYPKNPNNLQEMINGIFDAHPEFKMELKTDKAEQEGAEDKHHAFYTMPPVDKDRRKLLNEAAKTFHKECVAKLEWAYDKRLADTAQLLTRIPIQDADNARKVFEKTYNDAKENAEKLLNAKLQEIEEGYQRYLAGKGNTWENSYKDDTEIDVSSLI